MNPAFCRMFFLILIPVGLSAQGFLQASGTRIADSDGKEIILRGMGLGGWMLQEGYMLEIYERGTQHEIRQQIADLVGEKERDRFYDQWLANHVTRADIDSMAKWGFNSIRLPMHYNLFTLPIEEEPAKGSQTWIETGFALTDSLLSWCKANRLYLILDLHAAPGGQGKDRTISDYDSTKASLWEDRFNQDKTVALWEKLAQRYASEPWIGGYDLINEPNWTFEGKDPHGREDKLNQPIWELYKRITEAIRSVDPHHMIIIEGNGWGNNYSGFPGPWDKNLVLSFHKYWNPNRQENIDYILQARENWQMPVWLGESGENSNKWFADGISLLERNEIGWAWWPLKKINSVVCPLKIKAPEEYNRLTDYWNGKSATKPSTRMATETLRLLAANLRAPQCRLNKDVIDAMFRQQSDTTTLPFAPNRVPVRMYATDFDLGYPGRAYFDADNEAIGEPGAMAGNKGYRYRNDGVDIEESTDSSMFTNGYCVFETEAGEWLQYTLFNEKPAAYQLNVRVSTGTAEGSMVFELNGLRQPYEVLTGKGKPDQWKTINAGTLLLTEGMHTLRLRVIRGGFRLGFIEIIQGRSL